MEIDNGQMVPVGVNNIILDMSQSGDQPINENSQAQLLGHGATDAVNLQSNVLLHSISDPMGPEGMVQTNLGPRTKTMVEMRDMQAKDDDDVASMEESDAAPEI